MKSKELKAIEVVQERFKNLIDSNIIGVAFGDIHGNIKDANESFLSLIGYTKEDLLSNSLNIRKITPEKYQDLFKQTAKQLSTGKSFATFEKEYIHKEGRLVPVLVSVATLDENHQETVAFILDLTKCKEAEEKIEQQAALLDITKDAIIVYDFENTILFWNKAAEKIYGWPSQEIVEKADYSELFKSDQVNYNDLLEILLTDGYWEKELELQTKDNKIIIECRLTLMYDSKNVPISILAVHTDITKKKKLETQFLQAQRLESLGKLASGIAHDLNNILAPILMSTDLLKKQISPEKSASIINIIESVTLRGADLVKQILAFAKGAKGEFADISVKHILLDIEKILLQIFPKSINTSINIANNLFNIFADATQIHQLLMNLAINARDAMPEGGNLEIKAENVVIDSAFAVTTEIPPGQYVLISVKDTGIGIAPEHISQIYDPFFTTKEPGKGTGLGLSTVSLIISHHKGFIKVSSELKKGTIFKLYLPASNSPSLQSSPQQSVGAKNFYGQGKLVLIVDDELSIQQITQASLESFGYKTLVASDGVEAVATYAENKDSIELVITDMVMPIMEGAVMLRIMEKLNPNIKAIISSGVIYSKSTTSINNCIKAFLPKPYTAEELLKTVSNVLSE